MKIYASLIKKLIPVHLNKHSLKSFILLNRILWSIAIILFLGVATLFSLYGVTVDDISGTKRTKDGSNLFLIFGLILFLLAILYCILIGIIIPTAFRKSQQEFFKTKKFQQEKNKINGEGYLEKLSLKELKWQKKLCYINNQTFHIYKNQINLTKKTKK